MGKRAEQDKKRKRTAALPRSTRSPSASLISQEDLETTAYVLRTLCENPDELTGKTMKEIKRATYELHRVMADGAALGKEMQVSH
jgi:hypothetical protein